MPTDPDPTVEPEPTAATSDDTSAAPVDTPDDLEPPLPTLADRAPTGDLSDALDEPIPLSVLLDAHEIATLHNQQPSLNPDEYTVVTLPAEPQIRVSARLGDGSYVMGLQVRVPPGLFREARIIDPRRGGNPLDNALGMLPAVRMVVRIDRLSTNGQNEIQRQLAAAMKNQMPGAPDA